MQRPSSRAPHLLPDPAALWRRLIALAALDRLLSPDWYYRYYSFDAAFGPGLQVGSMRNGSGDDFFVGFSAGGVFFKGFDHESSMSPYAQDPLELWPGIYEGCPESLHGFRDEPAFSTAENATFALWWDAADPGWRVGVESYAEGEDPDGSEWLLDLLGAGPEGYLDFAQGYYEEGAANLELEFVQQVYAHEPLSETALAKLAPEDAGAALGEILAMGYGSAFPFASG